MKDREKVLVAGMSRVVREKPVSGSIRQLSVRLSKIINLVEDHLELAYQFVLSSRLSPEINLR